MSLLGQLSGAWRRHVAPPPAPLRGGWYRREEAIMGTAIEAELWAETPARAEAALDAVMGEMHRIDRQMSPHREDSELSRINREAGHRPVALSAEMARLIGRALELSLLSDGAFDISYAAAGQLYDYRAGVAPDAATLRDAVAKIGWRALHLDRQASTLRFGRPGMHIDLGGFAKGHAVDNAIALLKARGIRHAMVAAGGDSHVMGEREGRPWTIAIRDPRRAADVVAVLPLSDVSISTSGDYERYFERDGVRHHHLLDPRTGGSARAVRSVTILAEDGLTSEALSKTVFVLGVGRGLSLIESLPDVDAVIVDADGALHFSSGLRDGRP